jgi:hypothetical protein
MLVPLDELNAQIEELRVDLAFVALAARLRPRIGDVVQWKASGDALELVRRFMKTKPTGPEGIYGPLLVRLMASFERYLRRLIAWALDKHTAAAGRYDRLPPALAARNLILTGKLLATLDSPRDYLAVDVELLLENLASCRRENAGGFRLNGQAFSAVVAGVSPENVEKALETVEVRQMWDELGASNGLVEILGTKGARETGQQSRERLKELSRYRNQLAHGADAAVVITENQLRDAISFILAFSSALGDRTAKEFAS